MHWRRLSREPLIHFLLAGAALFLWYHWRGGAAGPGSTRIVLSAGQVDHLAAGFERTWQRPANEAELKGLVDEWVREEIAVREAMAMGLDRDDTVIRRRLRQKFEFLVEDVAPATPPTDAELQAWLDSHADSYRVEPRVALRQVFVSRARHGAAAEARARALLARLAAAGPEAPADDLGDPTLLPSELGPAPESEVERSFGRDFAERVARLPAGVWSGPIESSYGLHVVLVRERVPGALPALASVRQAVARDLLLDRRDRQLAQMYEKLLAKYTVVVEGRREAPPAGQAQAPKGTS